MAIKLNLGPKHVQLAKSFLPSAVFFGAGAGLLGLFFVSSWKGEDLLKFVPIYNKKYDPKDPEM